MPAAQSTLQIRMGVQELWSSENNNKVLKSLSTHLNSLQLLITHFQALLPDTAVNTVQALRRNVKEHYIIRFRTREHMILINACQLPSLVQVPPAEFPQKRNLKKSLGRRTPKQKHSPLLFVHPSLKLFSSQRSQLSMTVSCSYLTITLNWCMPLNRSAKQPSPRGT